MHEAINKMKEEGELFPGAWIKGQGSQPNSVHSEFGSCPALSSPKLQPLHVSNILFSGLLLVVGGGDCSDSHQY